MNTLKLIGNTNAHNVLAMIPTRAPATLARTGTRTSRDPGFLGAKYGYIYLTQIETGPNGLIRPPDVDASREDRRETLLAKLRNGFAQRHPGASFVQAQSAISQQGFKLAC